MRKSSAQNSLSGWYVGSFSPRVICLVLHGLNLRPSAMHAISSSLWQNQAWVYQGALEGHHGSYQNLQKVSREDWLSDFQGFLEQAKNESQKQHVPLVFIGFSLGALLALDWITQTPEQSMPWQSQILLAPPLFLRAYLELAPVISSLPSRLPIPSRAPPSYRLYSSTPVGAYQAFFENYHQLKKQKAKLPNIPTQVLIDPRDELIAYSKLKAHLDKKHLTKWQLHPIWTHPSKKNSTPYHLIIDPHCTGTHAWQKLQATFNNHL